MGKEVVGITGASGFIGRALIDKFETDGVKYRVIDRIHNLSDQVGDCTAMIHLGSINDSSSPDIQMANVEYTQSLIGVLPADCILIFTSSFAVYKTPSKDEIITEDYPTDPRNRYGQTKLEAEKFIERSGLNAWILRLSNAYGSGMPPFKHSVVATFNELIKQDKELTIDGDGSQTRDFLNVEDVVLAINLCLKQESTGVQILNICSGVETSLNNLVQKLSQKQHKKPKLKYNTAADMTTAGYWKGDWSKAHKLLGWKPTIYI